MLTDTYYPERAGMLLATIDFMVISDLMPLDYAKGLLGSLKKQDETHNKKSIMPDIMERLEAYVAKKEKQKEEWMAKNPHRVYSEQLIVNL